jgi:phosphoribosylformylglycinamidine synthase
VVAGFARSFGLQVPAYATATATATAQEAAEQMRVEWLKPVMFTAGVGWLDDAHTVKGAPEVGMLVCKMGGPAYRIGK